MMSVYRRKMLEETELFDDAYFAYLEDLDLAMRGWSVFLKRVDPEGLEQARQRGAHLVRSLVLAGTRRARW